MDCLACGMLPEVHWTLEGLSHFRLPGVCPCLLELAGCALCKSLGCSRLLIFSQSACSSLRWPGCLHMVRRAASAM